MPLRDGEHTDRWLLPVLQAIVYWNELEIGRTPVFEDSCDPEFKAKYSIRVPLSEVKSNVLRVELFDFGAPAAALSFFLSLSLSRARPAAAS